MIAHVGVDPGKSGFITIHTEEHGYDFYPMPEHKIDTGKVSKTGKPVMKTVYHEAGLSDLMKNIYLKYKSYKLIVYIEEVGGRGGWSATNNFNFGYQAGMLKMLFLILNADITMIRPQKWQSEMRRGYPDIRKPSSTGKTQIRDPKAIAEMIVNKEFPEIDFRKSSRATKIDDNKVDSFLICQYAMRKQK